MKRILLSFLVLTSFCSLLRAQTSHNIVIAERLDQQVLLHPAAVPVADFTSNAVTVCEDGTIQFTDLSTNAPTSWQWLLPGGLPTSTAFQNPLVQYNVPGIYDVTLIVANVDGSDTLYMPNYIEVKVKPFAQVRPGVSHQIGICPNDSIQLFANTKVPGNYTYQWYRAGTLLGTDSTVWATKAGFYKVKVTDVITGCTKPSGLRSVEAYPRPFVFVFTPAGNTICDGDSMLFSAINNPGIAFQWYRGSNPINGATSSDFYAKKNGYYRVEFTNEFGCKKKSSKFGLPLTITCRTGQDVYTAPRTMRIAPNPAADFVQVQLSPAVSGELVLNIYDVTGRLVLQNAANEVPSDFFTTELNVEELPKGVYIVQATVGSWQRTSRLVISK